jgi:hypothetical protein
MRVVERATICILILFAAVGLHQVTAIFMQTHGWKGLSPSDWAAWVQAVGSIAAIAGAFQIAQSQHKREHQQALDRADEDRQAAINAELVVRTTAIQNLVQVASHALLSATHLVDKTESGTPPWDAGQYASHVEQIRVVLDSMISPSTNNLAVVASLQISLILTQIKADMQNAGGSMRDELIERSRTRVLDGYDFLTNLINLQNSLIEICKRRGALLTIDDLR